jgi:hypothetical protein
MASQPNISEEDWKALKDAIVSIKSEIKKNLDKKDGITFLTQRIQSCAMRVYFKTTKYDRNEVESMFRVACVMHHCGGELNMLKGREEHYIDIYYLNVPEYRNSLAKRKRLYGGLAVLFLVSIIVTVVYGFRQPEDIPVYTT